tara:strand:- start:790 stop:1086 length:297 start_codon:yes stop_codon:yes gene_type:complete
LAAFNIFFFRLLRAGDDVALGIEVSPFHYDPGRSRFMRPMSAELTNVADRRRRFLFVDFLLRMWLLYALILLILPLPVRRKRLAAPRLVFIFGISSCS